MARGNLWSDEEVHALIAIWGEEEVQSQLDGATRNKKVYDDIAKKLTELGFHRTGQQCREKIKKLKSDYRRAKDRNNLTGRGRSILNYFTELDAILGSRPTSAPDNVVGSMAQEPQAEEAEESQEQLNAQLNESTITETISETNGEEDSLSQQESESSVTP